MSSDLEQGSSSDDESDLEEKIPLNDAISMFPRKKLSRYRKVVAGEIRCLDRNLSRPCAIKFDPQQITHEVEALHQLGSHSNIIFLIASGTYKDIFCDFTYLVMEKHHDLNLEDYVLMHTVPLYDVTRGMKYCEQIINGMKYIHENLIIHKDLKPSNILLTHDLANIKIADFGSSQKVKSPSSAVRCQFSFGTLGYYPPESLNMSYVSLTSDSFSLGVVFYFLLSNGRSPFGPESDRWDHNTLNGVVELSGLLVPNPMATGHLIKHMLNVERCCRPSIGDVEYHPCWRGGERDLRFEYRSQEFDDCKEVVIATAQNSQKESDGDELLRALHLIDQMFLPEQPKKLMQSRRFVQAAETLRLLYDFGRTDKLLVERGR